MVKKLLALLFAASLSFAVIGCEGGDEDPVEDAVDQVQEGAEDAADAAEDAADDAADAIEGSAPKSD